MSRVVFSLSAAPGMAEGLARCFEADLGELETRQFPDGETYLRIATPVSGRDVVLLCTLDRPDAKIAPLLFAADALRDQGARSIALVAPYLAYMRQDKAFNEGEAVTSVTFARLLSRAFDGLITVDPHLHRHPDLGAVYSIPAIAVQAAPAIAAWIRREVPNPLLIGPDEESGQWVEEIASLAGAPYAVLRKERRGDYDVSISADNLPDLSNLTPVIIDDIASSARTMIEAAHILRETAAATPIAIVVHPILAGDAFGKLQAAGTARVVSTDTIAHPSNAISVVPQIAAALKAWRDETARPESSSAGRQRVNQGPS